MVVRPVPKPLRGLCQSAFPVRGSRQKTSPEQEARTALSSMRTLTKSQPLRRVVHTFSPVERFSPMTELLIPTNTRSEVFISIRFRWETFAEWSVGGALEILAGSLFKF